eukprot:scaffold44705_cov70-Phaeocystis_antarctica.AAC.5
MKTATFRLRSAALRSDPLRAISRIVSASATTSISTSGHSPLKARRVISPPTHFQSGKMKLPKSKSNSSGSGSQLVSSLGKVLSIKAGLKRVSSRTQATSQFEPLRHTSRRRSRALATLGQRREPT